MPNPVTAGSARAGIARAGGRAARASGTAALLVLVALAALMLLPPLAGYRRYVIEGGSMGSAVPRGSIAFERTVPTEEIEPGDVITYTPPHATRPVTHRVVSISEAGVFRTKGDANPRPDPWTFTLPQASQARVAFHVPLAGYLLTALEFRAARIAVIGIPALLIAIAAFAEAGRGRGRAPSFG